MIKINTIILSILISSFAIGQTDTTETGEDTLKSGTIKAQKKYNEADFFPRVNGKFTGSIHPFELCNSDGIQTNAGIKISSFELHTFDKSGKEIKYPIEGNVLPKKYCEKLAEFQEGEVFYIRNIRGIGRYGEQLILNPILFTISYK